VRALLPAGRLPEPRRRLKFLNCETKHAAHYILACCILHNFIQRKEGPENSNLTYMARRAEEELTGIPPLPEHPDIDDDTPMNEDYDTSSDGAYDGRIPAEQDLEGGRMLLAELTAFCFTMHARRVARRVRIYDSIYEEGEL
jgi:hypothetical protein